jgi:hypothetical protein
MKLSAIKIIGGIAMILTAAAGLAGTWASDRQMELTVEEKVNEALAKKEEEKEDEEES